MTLTAQPGRTIFTGNGSTIDFTYNYSLWATTDIVVVHYDTLTDTETTLNPALYSVTPNGSDTPYPSAVIRYPLSGSPIPATEQLAVYRQADLTQEIDLATQGAYFLRSIEAQLDRLTGYVQTVQDQIDRALVLPVTTPMGKTITMGPPVSEAVLRWPDDVSGDCKLESVDIVDLIVEDSRTQQVIEQSFESDLFNDAWDRQLGVASDGIVVSGFNADEVDGYNVMAGTTPASGLLKVGDYGVGAPVGVSGMDLDNLITDGSFEGDTLTNAPSAGTWFIRVHVTGQEISQFASMAGASDIIYTRSYNDGLSTWGDWYRIWTGSDGVLMADLNADQVDGHDVDSSQVPTDGLLKPGDWGGTYQTLDLSGLSANATNTISFHGSNMGNAPTTGFYFIDTMSDGTSSVQLAMHPILNTIQFRGNNAGVWSSWSQPVSFEDHTHLESHITDLDKYTQTEVDAALALKANLSLVGSASGICPLDSSSLVDPSYLPSYVDDVLEYADFASLPGTGETGKIYVTLDTGNIYRWSGSAYIEINTSVATADEALVLSTARTIQVSGDAAGSASFDGSADINIVVNVTDSESLGGVAAANYLRSDVADTVGGVLLFQGAPRFVNNVAVNFDNNLGGLRQCLRVNVSDVFEVGHTDFPLALASDGTFTHNGDTVWTSGNDGVGSGLDAGLLGGVLPSGYATLTASQTFGGENTFESQSTYFGENGTGHTVLWMWDDTADTYRALYWNNTENDWYIHDFSGIDRRLYHGGNDSNLAKLDTANTFTSVQTFSGTSPGLILQETDTTTRAVFNQDGGNLYIQASGAGYTGGGNIRITGESNSDIGTFIVRSGGADRTVYHTGNDSNLLKLNQSNTITGQQLTISNTLPILRMVDSDDSSFFKVLVENGTSYFEVATTGGVSGGELLIYGPGGADLANNSILVKTGGVNRTIYHTGNDSTLVKTFGDQTIGDNKSFTGNIGIGISAKASHKLFVSGEQFVDYSTGGDSGGGCLRIAANSNQSFLGSNQYYSSPSTVYSRNGGSGIINLDITTGTTAGDITLYTAPSGTADSAISYHESLRIKQGGGLQADKTTNATVNTLLTLNNSGSGTGTGAAVSFTHSWAQVGKISNYWNGSDWVLGFALGSSDVMWATNTGIGFKSEYYLDFYDEEADKAYYYSNTFGVGIETDTLTHWANNSFRWRSGGTDRTAGTQTMHLDGSGNLTTTGSITANGNSVLEANSINGSFTTTDGKTITVVDGQITAIV